MKEYKLVFTAYINADSMESAIDKAQADYGNEVADYATITQEGENDSMIQCDLCGEYYEHEGEGEDE